MISAVIRPGDTVLLTIPCTTARAELDSLRDAIARYMPNVKVVVLNDGITVEAVYRPEPDSEPSSA